MKRIVNYCIVCSVSIMCYFFSAEAFAQNTNINPDNTDAYAKRISVDKKFPKKTILTDNKELTRVKTSKTEKSHKKNDSNSSIILTRTKQD